METISDYTSIGIQMGRWLQTLKTTGPDVYFDALTMPTFLSLNAAVISVVDKMTAGERKDSASTTTFHNWRNTVI